MDSASSNRRANKPLAAAMRATALAMVALFPPVIGLAAGAASRTQDVPAFTQVAVSLPAEVRIHQSGTSRVRITAEPAVQDKIEVGVSGGTLKVTTRGSFSTQQPLVIDIDTRELKRLEADDGSNVVVDSLKGDQLAVVTQGSGEVTLNKLNLRSLKLDSGGSGAITSSGRVAQQEVRISGSGEYRGEQMQSERASVNLTGAASAAVWATQSLKARVDGAGSIRYRGNPQIQQDIAGAGSIEQF
jgi:hypothetical protein